MDGSIRRSWLMVPSDDAAQVEQAATSAADVVVLDLMEFVPEAMKPAAREAPAGSHPWRGSGRGRGLRAGR